MKKLKQSDIQRVIDAVSSHTNTSVSISMNTRSYAKVEWSLWIDEMGVFYFDNWDGVVSKAMEVLNS